MREKRAPRYGGRGKDVGKSAGARAGRTVGKGARMRSKACRKAISACLLLGFPALLFGAPRVREWILEGGRTALFRVLPAVFPYLVLTFLVCRTGVARRVGRLAGRPFSRLFALPPACASAVFLGLLSGFPLGAKCAAELYREGLCGKEDAERLLAFCNFCGAPFILSAVGQGIFGSPAVGWLIFAVQSAAALLFGIFYRRPKRPVSFCALPAGQSVPLTASLFAKSVAEAGLSGLSIVSFILFFSIPAGALRAAISHFPALIPYLPLFVGTFEISSGVSTVGCGGLPALALCCLVVGFSGLSVMMQVRSFAAEGDLSMRGYVAAHLLCPPTTALVCCLAARTLGLV